MDLEEHDDLVEFLSVAMEQMESWPCTDRDFIDAVGRLSQNLESRVQMQEAGQSPGQLVHDVEDLDDLIHVAGYLRAPPSIRLLHLAGRIQPGIGGSIVTRSAEHVRSAEVPEGLRSVSRVMLDRITILARGECYARVFGVERRMSVLDLLEELHGEVDEAGA